MKIIYLPLDDRPINTAWVRRACAVLPVTVATPVREELGSRRRGADFNRLASWLLSLSSADDILVISMDALIHGGLIQGRAPQGNSGRLDETVKLLTQLRSKVGRNGKILAFYVWKRIWGNLFSEEDISKLGDYQKLSYAIADEVKSKNKELSTYLRFLARGVQLQDWMDRKLVMEFASRRLQQRRDVLALLELRRDVLDFLHVAREDNNGRGITPLEIACLQDEANRIGVTFSTAEGGDEAGMLMLAYTINNYLKRPLHELTIQVTDPENLRRIPEYEGVTLENTLSRFTQIAKISTNPSSRLASFLNVTLEGSMERGDPLLTILDGQVHIPIEDQVLGNIQPCKDISRMRLSVNLSAINGVNFQLVDWLGAEKTLPLTMIQSGTIANRIGYGFFLGSVLRYGLEKKVPDPGTWSHVARTIISTYLEEVVYCGYLRTWAMKKFGGMEPSDSGNQALAEVEMSNFLREYARRKFNNALFLERRINILDARLRLPWGRWFEAEVEVNVQPK